MKKIISLCVMVCIVFGMTACADNKPAESTATTTTTEPATKEYVLVKAKTDIAKDTQMTEDNIDVLFEAFTTSDSDVAKNAIRWANRQSEIQYLWTKDDIAIGTIVNPGMFSTTIPDGVLPSTDEELDEPLYDKSYTAIACLDGLYVDIPAFDLLEALQPEVQILSSLSIKKIDIKIFDKNEPDSKIIKDVLIGDYNLAEETGTMRFYLDTSQVNLSIFEEFTDKPELIPLLAYTNFKTQNFQQPVVQMVAYVETDALTYRAVLGGSFDIILDPALSMNQEWTETIFDIIESEDFQDVMTKLNFTELVEQLLSQLAPKSNTGG